MLDIGWNEIPEKYKWAAQDEDGEIWAFYDEPLLTKTPKGVKEELNMWDSSSIAVSIKYGKPNADWRNTLTKRPEK